MHLLIDSLFFSQQQLQPFIFSVVLSFFYGITWSDLYVKGTVFIPQN